MPLRHHAIAATTACQSWRLPSSQQAALRSAVQCKGLAAVGSTPQESGLCLALPCFIVLRLASNKEGPQATWENGRPGQTQLTSGQGARFQRSSVPTSQHQNNQPISVLLCMAFRQRHEAPVRDGAGHTPQGSRGLTFDYFPHTKTVLCLLSLSMHRRLVIVSPPLSHSFQDVRGCSLISLPFVAG